jgi:hypothetical protein
MSGIESFDDKHGNTVVSSIVINLHRNGMMAISGSITDEKYARYLLDTARQTLTNYHLNQKKGLRSQIIVPAHDTALVGTPEEKLLLNARHDLANAMAGS